MKLRLPFLVLLVSTLVSVLPAKEEKTEFLFEMRSATVEYETSTVGKGVNTTGTEVFSFVDRGQKSCRRSKATNTTKFLGRTKTEETNTNAIIRDGWIYTFDEKTRTGTKMSMEQVQQMAQSMGKGAQGQTARGYAKEFVENNGGQWLGTEEFLGRKCDVFTLWGFKTWAYKGVPLKTEGTMMGITTRTVATKFDENAAVPASMFEIPDDIQFQDMSQMMGMLGGLFGGGSKGQQAQPAAEPETRRTKGKAVVEEEPAEDAPSPKPEPVKKKKAEPKKVVKKADPRAVGVSEEKFAKIVAKLHVSGHTTMAPESLGGGHTVNLIDTKGGAMGVTLLPLEVADGLEQSDSLKVESNFKHDGHGALAGILKGDEGDSSIVMVRYPEKKLALLVSSNPVRPKEELMALLTQIEL